MTRHPHASQAPAMAARAVPDRPVLDGIEQFWSRRWAQVRVVQI